jgi:major membrane immunogen (membrane-anchored lipoprotein)
MKKAFCVIVILAVFIFAGCSSNWGSAGLGAVGGAAASAGGYEYHLKKEKDRVEQDFKDGKIDEREYEIRKDQIERDSLVN